MNKELFKNQIVLTKENIWEEESLPQGNYDGYAVQYDKLISNGLYNRIMWRNKPSDYAAFQLKNLKHAEPGVMADIGCGTLSFTSKVYAEHLDQEIYLCDFSAEMMKLGMQRLEAQRSDLSLFNFLRADALKMPFKNGVLQTVLSYGLLHIFDNPKQLLSEFNRILEPGGQLHMTVLCTDRKFSAWYLGLLHKKGHVAKPMSSTEITNLVETADFGIIFNKVKGGMLYLSANKR